MKAKVLVGSDIDMITFGNFKINYKDLKVGEKIGSGSSGDVFKYKIRKKCN
jgi:hypothetical protein